MLYGTTINKTGMFGNGKFVDLEVEHHNKIFKDFYNPKSDASWLNAQMIMAGNMRQLVKDFGMHE
jgi:hypothetical protein